MEDIHTIPDLTGARLRLVFPGLALFRSRHDIFTLDGFLCKRAAGRLFTVERVEPADLVLRRLRELYTAEAERLKAAGITPGSSGSAVLRGMERMLSAAEDVVRNEKETVTWTM